MSAHRTGIPEQRDITRNGVAGEEDSPEGGSGRGCEETASMEIMSDVRRQGVDVVAEAARQIVDRASHRGFVVRGGHRRCVHRATGGLPTSGLLTNGFELSDKGVTDANDGIGDGERSEIFGIGTTPG
ncbi:hypothetical protein CVV72_10595 [Amycolatopsis sp. TNS106]|nr:hypothetical protein CVV72_10595 [Amycolatopsis sp. TNS106]